MTFSFCFCHHLQLAIKPGYEIKSPISNQLIQRSTLSLQTVSRRQHSTQPDGKLGLRLRNYPGFLPRSRSIIQPNLKGSGSHRKKSRVVVLCLGVHRIPIYANEKVDRFIYNGFEPSQIASSVFTIGTAGVLPFYTLMVVAPRAKLTRISMKSYIPYIVLGLLYAYLLYLSWSPDTLQYMFGNASSYYLPELSGMLKMFSNDMTLASAWIHLLAIDLFAARQIYHDGLQNDIETRHSVSLCLLFCPIGVLTHVITKSLSTKQKN